MFSYLKSGIVLALLLVSVSCEKVGDDEVPVPVEPVLNIRANQSENPSQLILDVGDTAFISASAIAEGTIKSFVSYVTIDGTQKILHQVEVDSAMTQSSIDLQFYFDYTFSGKSVSFLYVVIDQLDQSDSAEFMVHVNESRINTFENIRTGVYNHESLGNFYNVVADTIYFPNNLRTSTSNQEGVDFIFSFNTTSKFSVSSPDDPNAPLVWDEHVQFQWPFQRTNRTRFLLLDDTFDYDAIVTAAQLDDFVFPDDTTITSVAHLAEKQLIAFKLDDRRNGRKGILKIKNISGSANATRVVTFDFKIQE